MLLCLGEPPVPLVNSPVRLKGSLVFFFSSSKLIDTHEQEVIRRRRPPAAPLIRRRPAPTARRNPTKGNRSSLLLVRDLQVCCCSPRHQPPPRICKRHAFSHSGSKPACSTETTQASSKLAPSVEPIHTSGHDLRGTAGLLTAARCRSPPASRSAPRLPVPCLGCRRSV